MLILNRPFDFLIFILSIQYLLGVIYFSSELIINSLYLLGFITTFIVGFNVGKLPNSKGVSFEISKTNPKKQQALWPQGFLINNLPKNSPVTGLFNWSLS